jgi:ankyrin repeat protein
MKKKPFNMAAATPQQKGRALLKECGRSPPNLWKVNDLIINGADLEQRDAEGLTPLLRATKLNSTGAALLLISFGADVGAEDKSGDTALIFADKHHNLKVVKVLQDYHAPSRGNEGFISSEMWDRHMEHVREEALAEEARETKITLLRPFRLKNMR